MNVVKTLAVSGVIAVVLVFVSISPSCIATMGPKDGRIIDHDTGNGIASADVVIVGSYRQKGTYQNVYFCTYAELAKTDSNGFYHFPSEYEHWHSGSKSDEPENLWRIYASKDGYVQGGTRWPFEYDTNGEITPSVFAWTSVDHPAALHGLHIQISPIELMQVKLSVAERIAYFSYTGLGKTCNTDDSSFGEMRRAVHQFYESITRSICDGATGEPSFNSYLLHSLIQYADDTQTFYAAWRKLDPDVQAHQSLAQSVPYRSDQVCQIAQAGEKR